MDIYNKTGDIFQNNPEPLPDRHQQTELKMTKLDNQLTDTITNV